MFFEYNENDVLYLKDKQNQNEKHDNDLDKERKYWMIPLKLHLIVTMPVLVIFRVSHWSNKNKPTNKNQGIFFYQKKTC